MYDLIHELNLIPCTSLRAKRQDYEKGLDEKMVRGYESWQVIAQMQCWSICISTRRSDMKHHISQVLYGNEHTHVPETKRNCLSQPVETVRDIENVAGRTDNIVSTQQSSQGMTNYMVNYNKPKSEQVPCINVYPIINIPQGLNPGTPIIINVNLTVEKWFGSNMEYEKFGRICTKLVFLRCMHCELFDMLHAHFIFIHSQFAFLFSNLSHFMNKCTLLLF